MMGVSILQANRDIKDGQALVTSLSLALML